ncbi:MAG: hypothetical protein QGH25_18835, partial [Candidatus Latescibacteria bacterium]|nr:hypothetical protein [Candidatus Latescibacterota bacterium]
MKIAFTRKESRYLQDIERWDRVGRRSERLSYDLLVVVATAIAGLALLFALRHSDDPRVLWFALPLAL